jgi:hypothetical protein
MWGKDMYYFHIVRQNGNGAYSILPAGTVNDTQNPPTTCAVGDGWGCAATRFLHPDSMP